MADAATNTPTVNYEALSDILAAASASDEKLFRAIVNAPFAYPLETAFMFLGIIVLLQVDKDTGMIDRVALSNTELAKNTTNVSYVPFNDIKIPLNHPSNIIASTIREREPHDTTDWRFLFEPALTAEQARMNQASGGIAFSAVHPLNSRDGGAMIFSYFQYAQNIGDAQRDFMDRYVSLVDEALAKQQ
jgi:hypothetical protein